MSTRPDRLDRDYVQEKPGLYAVRLAKGAVEVACLVSHDVARDPETGEPLDRSLWWVVEIDGKPVHGAPSPYERMLIGREIDQSEFDYLLARTAHARMHRPSSPEANPRERVNLATASIPFL